MKKALLLASVASMIDQFNMSNIKLLQSLGYHVDVVADYTNAGNISSERSEELMKRLGKMGAEPIDIPIPRSMNPSAIHNAYKAVNKLISTEHYDLIHCHSPIGGVIARLAAKGERKTGTKVIYTAHGFHFYSGAPLKNWLLFYPAEKYLSKYTDVLITINKEDYKRAQEKFKAKETVYIPGIGVDVDKFGLNHRGDAVRMELGIRNDDVMLLSVGELNENKNHEMVIRALGKMQEEDSRLERPYYIIVGKGDKRERLEQIIKDNGSEDRIKLVGFRDDVADFYDAADAFVFPSFREGLSVSLMEAMASGLPVACSNIRGNIDLIDEHGGVFFEPANVDSIEEAITKLLYNKKRNHLGEYNLNKIKAFDIETVEKAMSEVYKDNCLASGDSNTA